MNIDQRVGGNLGMWVRFWSKPSALLAAETRLIFQCTQITNHVDRRSVLCSAECMILHARTVPNVTQYQDLDSALTVAMSRK